jgi:exodeoxyribonuclease VII small subunit
MPDTDAASPAPAFEDALRQLEELVRSLEAGDVPLATLIERYEAGTRLLRACESRLKEAELRIEQIRQTKDGVQLEKFGTTRS